MRPYAIVTELAAANPGLEPGWWVVLFIGGMLALTVPAYLAARSHHPPRPGPASARAHMARVTELEIVRDHQIRTRDQLARERARDRDPH